MANTFSQIYLQFVFAVKQRESLIAKEHKDELHKYITGLVQNRETKMLAIHCMPDHTHLFAGIKPTVLISDLVKEVKWRSMNLSTVKNGLKENLAGKRAMESSLIHIHRLGQCSITS